MIAELLPGSVAVAETYGDDEAAPLYPEERALMADAVERRRREFATVRACARRAMAELGRAPRPIPSCPRGAPCWPPGLVGSMTHCDGYRAAAVAHATDLASVGIDAEPHAPLPKDVLDAVRLPSEQWRLRYLSVRHPAVHWDQLLFSAKESVYKAWFPLTGDHLDFADADIEFEAAPGSPPRGGFRAALLVPGPLVGGRRLTHFEGRWVVRKGLAATAVTVPHT
ncbi:4'-phosphopantetheinyl transferase superfamily protein [Streptomyces sp. GESEQ-35]|uniref:4'-phosphopantetheinyl transferase family protein n=1 Tax=Streptomyces sp. GESEQ-35 TaxID=2812657 RepID=UPI001B32845B|nr:4'-phosphopantetheinyl transferase superfamily protein [Streptomyces sp. GESEQ-35]